MAQPTTRYYDNWCVAMPAFMVGSPESGGVVYIYHEGQALEVSEMVNDGVDVTFTHRGGELTVWHGSYVGMVELWTDA